MASKIYGESDISASIQRTIEFHNELIAFLSRCPVSPEADSVAGKELALFARAESLRTAYGQGSILANSALDCLTGFARVVTDPLLSVAPFPLARCTVEATAMAVWLLDAGIGPVQRVERSLAFRYEDLRQQQKFARSTGDLQLVSDIEMRISVVSQQAQALGYHEVRDKKGKMIGIGQYMKETTDLIDDVLKLGSVYRILSGMTHGLPSPLGQLSYKAAAEVTHPEGDVGFVRELSIAPVAVVWLCDLMRNLLAKVTQTQVDLFGWDRVGMKKVTELV